jgi:hypothetical protein
MMKKQKLHELGFGHVGLILVVLVIGVVGLVGWRVMTQDDKQTKNKGITNSPQEEEAALSDVRWENTSEGGWMAMGTPPECPEPFKLASPSPQLGKATSVLYPGQERMGEIFGGQGGNYKPHGGLRFDESQKPSDVQVVSPIDGYVYRGSQFLSNGEIQYTFDLVHPCGYMVRVGHLRELSDTFKKYADKFPPAQEGDSRTERVDEFPQVRSGDVIATAAGYNGGPNIFFDLGVFDLRQTNQASKDPAYQAKWASAKEHFYYGVCWFDMLPKADGSFIKTLPAGDPKAGKTSDYCK